MRFDLFKLGLKSILELLLAILFLVLLLFFIYTLEIKKIGDKVYTTATVVNTEFEREYNSSASDDEYEQVVEFEYEVNDLKYTGKLKRNLFFVHEGNEVEIYYLKSDPRNTGTRYENLPAILIMGGVGLFFLSLGIGDMKKTRRKREETIGVAKYGKELIVQYDSVVPAYIGAKNSSVSCNDYRIVCKYVHPVTYVEHRFTSDIISVPSDIIIGVIENYNIKEFKVKCDSSNMSIYVMDISELNKKIKEVYKK